MPGTEVETGFLVQDIFKERTLLITETQWPSVIGLGLKFKFYETKFTYVQFRDFLLFINYFYVIADEGLFPKASINVDKIFR